MCEIKSDDHDDELSGIAKAYALDIETQAGLVVNW